MSDDPPPQSSLLPSALAHGLEWGDGNGGQDARDSVAAARAFMDRLDGTMQKVAE